MKRKFLVAAIAAALFSAAAWAQWGPGMMGGYGPGYGGGPGMMGGYGGGGYGPGYGMGPGMMGGGYGPGYGMGPGMMGGYGGHGYYGGMGPGMMGGYGWDGYDALDLSKEQRDKVDAIQEDAVKKRWDLMRAMHELGWNSFGPGAGKDADPGKTYEAMADLRKQMFDTTIDANKRIEALLTKEQKEQLRKNWRRGW